MDGSRSSIPLLQAGDLLGYNSPTFVSHGIRRGTQFLDEPRSVWSHIEQAVGPDLVARQGLFKRIVKWNPLGEPGLVEVYRPTFLTPWEQDEIVEYHEDTVGRIYNVPQFIRFGWQGMWGWFGIKVQCRMLAELDKRFMVCSTDVANAFYQATDDRKPFGLPWYETTPDDAHDYVLAHPIEFKHVWSKFPARRGG